MGRIFLQCLDFYRNFAIFNLHFTIPACPGSDESDKKTGYSGLSERSCHSCSAFFMPWWSMVFHFAKAGLCYYNDGEVVKKNMSFQRGKSINSSEDVIKIIYGAERMGRSEMYRRQSRPGPVPSLDGRGAGRVPLLQICFLFHSLFDHAGAIAPDDYPLHINDRNRP